MDNRHDLTVGGVGQKLLRFAMPIVGINLLQAVYNIVDMIIVGRVCGSVGMSAVSIGGQITFFVLSACSGITNGGSVYISQRSGSNKFEESKSIVGTLLGFLILLSLALTGIVIAVRTPFLRVLNTPDECFIEASQYLTICMAGTVFVYVNDGLNAVLRGVGESLSPMLFVLITTVENFILDMLFVAVLGWGAAGAALATVICQFTSMALVISYTRLKTTLFDFRLSSFKIYPERLKVILRIGLPQSFQFISSNISFLLVSSLINTFGVSAAAAAGAANKISTFGALVARSLMSAETTFTAQNFAKRDFRRIRRGMWIGICASVSVSAVFLALCELAPSAMYAIFTSEEGVALVGRTYLRFYAVSFMDEAVLFCLNGVLTGAGCTLVTLLGSVVSAFGIRYIAAYLFSRFTPLGFAGVGLGYALAPFAGITISAVYLLSGRWKKSRINIDV